MRGLGQALRDRREALGLSLDEIAVATRIPVEHLRAIEQERPQDLPRGPYAAAYARLLQEHLQLQVVDDDLTEAKVEPEAAARAPAGAPLGLVRALGATSALAVLAMIGALAWQRFVPEPVVEAIVPDQRVVLTAKRSAHVRATVDGELVHEDVLPGGQQLVFEAHQRVELVVEATSAFDVEWNGEAVVPQGLQEHPRKLVFVDDVGPAPTPNDPPAPPVGMETAPIDPDEPPDALAPPPPDAP